MADNYVPVTVARGDGIGPEIMAASLYIMNEAGAGLDFIKIENLNTFDGQKGFVASQGE
jgi:isocitrate dehydrogenase